MYIRNNMLIRSIKSISQIRSINPIKYFNKPIPFSFQKCILSTCSNTNESSFMTNILKCQILQMNNLTNDDKRHEIFEKCNKSIISLKNRNKLLLHIKNIDNKKYLSIIESDKQQIDNYVNNYVSQNINSYDGIIKILDGYNELNNKFLQKYCLDFYVVKEQYPNNIIKQIFEQIDLKINTLFSNDKFIHMPIKTNELVELKTDELSEYEYCFKDNVKYDVDTFIQCIKILKKINHFNKTTCNMYLSKILNNCKSQQNFKIDHDNICKTNDELLTALYEMIDIDVDTNLIKRLFF